MSRKLLAIAFCIPLITVSVAAAQTMSLAVVNGGTYTRSFDVVMGEVFTVVTLLDTADHESSAAEWVQTDLIAEAPGVFRLGNVTPSPLLGPIAIDPSNGGEYVLAFGACVPPVEQLEVIQVSYLDVGDYTPDDFVFIIRGLQPGDSAPSSFDGAPGFVDCDNIKYAMAMSGGDAWETGAGVVVPSGALVLNPTPPLVIGAEGQPMSHLKARYR